MAKKFLDFYNFLGGVQKDIPSFVMNDNFCERIENMILEFKGEVKSAWTYGKLFSSLFTDPIISLHSFEDSGGNSKRLIQSGTSLFVDGNSTTCKTGLTANKKLRSAFFKDSGTKKLYLTNGTDKIFKTEGTSSVDVCNTLSDIICVHLNRIFIVDKTNKKIVRFSDNLSDANIDSNYFEVRTPQDDEITGLVSMNNYLFIFLTKSVVLCMGSSPGNFQQIQVSTAEGCIATDSIVKYGTTVFFMGKSGINYFDGNSVVNITKDNIRKEMNDILITDKANAVAGYYKRFYHLTATDKYGNKKTFVYNTEDNNFTICNYLGITATCNLETTRDNSDAIFSSSNANYVYQLGTGSGADGTDIEHIFEHRPIDMGVKSRTKLIHELWIDAYGSGTMYISVSDDNKTQEKEIDLSDYSNSFKWGEGTWGTAKWGSGTRTIIKIPLDIVRGKRIKLRVLKQSQGDFILNGYQIVYEAEGII